MEGFIASPNSPDRTVCGRVTADNNSPPSTSTSFDDRRGGTLEQLMHFRSARRPLKPPRTYLCHLCFGGEHFIQHCDLNRAQEERLTSYQSVQRYFGKFQFTNCLRTWVSSNSWANVGQDCAKCGTHVYTYKQQLLESRVHHGGAGNQSHPQGLCGKCQQIGFCCRIL